MEFLSFLVMFLWSGFDGKKLEMYSNLYITLFFRYPPSTPCAGLPFALNRTTRADNPFIWGDEGERGTRGRWKAIRRSAFQISLIPISSCIDISLSHSLQLRWGLDLVFLFVSEKMLFMEWFQQISKHSIVDFCNSRNGSLDSDLYPSWVDPKTLKFHQKRALSIPFPLPINQSFT